LNAALRVAIFSSDVSLRGPSSAVKPSSGWISGLKSAFSAFWWLASENSSSCFRESCHFSAMNSAEMPWLTRSNRSRIRGEKGPPSLPIGTRVMDSVPAPMASSAWPDPISAAANATAWRLEAQSRFTAAAGTVTGKPPASAALRAMLKPCSWTCVTQPRTMSSTEAGSTPLRLTSAAITSPARSSGRQWASAPSFLPIGVRIASRMTASLLTVASLGEIADDRVLLDLRGAFPNPENDRVHEPAAAIVLLHEPVAAVDLDGVEARLHRDLAAVELRLAAFAAGEGHVVRGHPRRLPDEAARRLDMSLRVGQLVADGLELDDRLLLDARLGVGHGRLVGRPGDAERGGGHHHAGRLQRRDAAHHAAGGIRAQLVLGGNADVVE